MASIVCRRICMKNRTVIGIDVGGTTTKIVGFRKNETGEKELIAPQFVRATDPMTSIYGAFGKFTAENGLNLSDIEKILMTGAGSSVIKDGIYNLPCVSVPEFSGSGIGGLYLSGLSEAIVVSMGTGTAINHAKKCGDKYEIKYLGGTGVGGGTLVGLSRRLIGVDTVEHIEQLAAEGDLGNIDLRIGDITRSDNLTELSRDLTASNFGNLSDVATKNDVSAGIINMIFESVGMLSAFGARSCGTKEIVLTGNLTANESFIKKIEQFNSMFKNEGIRFNVPKFSAFATVIGTALCG